MNCCVWWWSSWINGRSHLGPHYLLIAVLPVAEEDSCNRSLRPQPTAARHTHTHTHTHTYNKQTNIHTGTHTLKYPNTLKRYASRNQRVELNNSLFEQNIIGFRFLISWHSQIVTASWFPFSFLLPPTCVSHNAYLDLSQIDNEAFKHLLSC